MLLATVKERIWEINLLEQNIFKEIIVPEFPLNGWKELRGGLMAFLLSFTVGAKATGCKSFLHALTIPSWLASTLKTFPASRLCLWKFIWILVCLRLMGRPYSSVGGNIWIFVFVFSPSSPTWLEHANTLQLVNEALWSMKHCWIFEHDKYSLDKTLLGHTFLFNFEAG